MFRRLLVAFDGSPDSRRALACGIEMAKKMGAEIHAITVEEDLPAYATIGSIPEAPMSPEIIEAIEDQRTAYYRALRDEAQRIAIEAGVSLQAEIQQGNEVETIIAQAKNVDADLLVIGYHKHTMMRDRFLGSTAHALAVETPCSLLAVRA